MLVLSVGSTFGAAALGSLLYLVQRQRPQHRPFGRQGWRYTALATAWVAAVTTLATYALTMLTSGAVPSQVLAFAGPIGAGGVRAVSQRNRANDSASLQQLLTLGLPLVLDWLDQHLADIKQQQIDQWHARINGHLAVRSLIKRFHSRLDERRLPTTTGLVRRLEEREMLYANHYEAWVTARGPQKRELKVDVDVAIDDILRLVYEARADGLINDPTAGR